MMFNNPYFGAPFYRKPPRYSYYNPPIDNNFAEANSPICDYKEESKSNSSYDKDFFELFGLKLFFDDILLICLILFLYKEDVKDQGLFIALIMLLLS